MRHRTVIKSGQMVNHLPRTIRPIAPDFTPMPDRMREPFISVVLRRQPFNRSADLPLQDLQPAIRMETKKFSGNQTILLGLIHGDG
jgi:hypothetical protein